MAEPEATAKTEQSCQKCRDYRECAGKEFYTYSDIRWCPHQVIWILFNLDSLRAGIWPPECVETGYTDSPIGRRQIRHEGSFVKAVIILAEVTGDRLTRTGLAGKLLKAQVEAGKDITEFEPESMSALMYIKGKRRKRIAFSLWIAQKNYYKKYSKSQS